MVKFLEERGWCIYNGMVRGNGEGEYTFTGGRRNTVIDHIIGNIEVRNRIVRITVRYRVDSDHHPAWLEGEVKE